MTTWHIDAFDIETRDDAEWENSRDGDSAILRVGDAGWIFIPQGVTVTEIKPPFQAGYYTCKSEINGAVSYFTSESELDRYCRDYGYDTEDFIKVRVNRV